MQDFHHNDTRYKKSAAWVERKADDKLKNHKAELEKKTENMFC